MSTWSGGVYPIPDAARDRLFHAVLEFDSALLANLEQTDSASWLLRIPDEPQALLFCCSVEGVELGDIGEFIVSPELKAECAEALDRHGIEHQWLRLICVWSGTPAAEEAFVEALIQAVAHTGPAST